MCFSLPVGRILTSAVSGLAVLIASCLLLPAHSLRAQSEQPDQQIVQDGGDRDVQPTPDDAEVSKKPTFVINNVYVQLGAEHTTGTAIIATTSKYGYEGTVNYTCQLIKETKESSTPAECAMYPASAKVLVNGTATPEMLIFGKGTKLPPGATMGSNESPLKLVFGAGGAVLACGLLFAVPARRRAWRLLLPVLLLLVAMSSMTACVPWKQITTGGYTFKVTGVDSVNRTITAYGTVKVNVL